MGAAKKIKMVLIEREMTQVQLAEKLGRSTQTVRNMMARDGMSYETVEKIANLLDCDVVLKDRNTGKIY